MTEPTHVLTVLTSDRRGIVASISAALAALGIELIELTQTVMSGYFTITLVIALPEALPNSPELSESLASRIVERLGGDAAAILLPYKPPSSSKEASERFILTVSGEASTSVMQALSQLIAENGGNFLELDCQLRGGQLSVVAEIEFASEAALDAVQTKLQRFAETGNLRARLQHQRLFTATNEIAFRRVGS